MSDYKTRVTRMTVLPQGEDLFCANATHVSIEDEAAGEFVVVEQFVERYGKVAINPEEWPVIRKAIDDMITYCRKEAQP